MKRISTSRPASIRRDVGRDDDEDAAVDHGPEHAAFLVGVGRDFPTRAFAHEHAAQELRPSRLEDDVRGENGPSRGRSGNGPAEHPVDGRADEQQERHHGARRIPRQAEDELPAADAEEDGLARLDADLPEDRSDPRRLELTLDQIVIADGDAAGENEDVGRLRPAELRGEERLAVAGDTQVDRLGARLRGHGGECRSVGVADLAGALPLAGLDDLVARGDDGQSRPPGHRDAGQAGRGQHPDLGRAHERAPFEGGLALLQVFAGRPDVVAGTDLAPEDDAVPPLLAVLDHDHGIGARREGRAGHDADGLSGADGLARAPPRGQVFQDLELDGPPGPLRGRARVGGPDGITVHGRLGEGRDVLPGLDVPGQGPAQRRGQGDGFGGKRVCRGEDERPRV